MNDRSSRSSPPEPSVAYKLVAYVPAFVLAYFWLDSSQYAYWVNDGDISIYFKNYVHARGYDLRDYLAEFGHEWLFLTYTWLCAWSGLSFGDFLLLNRAFVLLAYCYFALWSLQQPVLAALASMLFVISPFFESYAFIIIRQGLALGFVLPAFVRLSERRLIGAAVWGGLAVALHVSSFFFLCLAALACSRRLKMLALNRVYVAAALFTVALYVSDLPATLFSGSLGRSISHFEKLSDLTTYYAGRYTIGFKENFFYLSSFQLLLCLAFLSMKSGKFEKLKDISRFCILITMAYMLLSGMAFHDRITYMAWTLLPILGMGTLRKFERE